MKRRVFARAALAATSALALAAGTAGAHPSDMLVDDGFLNSALDEHQAYGHGAEGSVPGRKELPTARGTGPQARRQDHQRAGVRRARPGRRRLGQGQLRLPDDVLRADMRPRRRADRRHLRPGQPVKRGYIPSHVDTFSGEGSQVVTMDTPVVQGRRARLPERVVPGHDQRRRRHLARRRDATRGRPKKLVEGAGDFTKKDGAQSNGVPQTKANQTHSAFAWESQRETAAGTSCSSTTSRSSDVDILDITNPSKPKSVAE